MIFGEILTSPQTHPFLYDAENKRNLLGYLQNHNATKMDYIMNYVVGGYILAVILSSLIMNTYLIYYNLKRKITLARKLFLILHFSDLLVNTFHPLLVTVDLFSPDLKELFQRNISMFQQLSAYIFIYMTYFTPISVTC